MLSQRPSFTTTMTAAVAIPGAHGSPQVVATSMSPRSPTTFHDRLRRGSTTSDGGYNIRIPKVLHPIDNDYLKLLVLENISQEAVAAFTSQGFHVDHYTKAMSEDELVEKIPNYHAIGIRRKTKITERVIKAASKVRVRWYSEFLHQLTPLFYGSFWSLDAFA
jgi:D-3-phosphoglycerate dehydrogenase